MDYIRAALNFWNQYPAWARASAWFMFGLITGAVFA